MLLAPEARRDLEVSFRRENEDEQKDEEHQQPDDQPQHPIFFLCLRPAGTAPHEFVR